MSHKDLTEFKQFIIILSSGRHVNTARVLPRTRARVTTATEAGAAPCPVPQAAGARAVATRVPVITAPRVTL